MTENTGSVHGTIEKALQQIQGNIMANLQCQKCSKFAFCVS